MSSSSFAAEKSIRSHSIHVAVARDYQRILRARKQEVKLQQDFLKLERKMKSHAKWNERADQRNASQMSSSNLANAQDRPPMTLKEFLAREKLKQEHIDNAKKVANENIRRR